MKNLLTLVFFTSCIFLAGCGKKIDEKDPVSILKNFVLLCEDGKIDEAQKLLAPKNDVDYFDKFKNLNGGKDLIFIDYDYKGNDNVINIGYELLKNLSSADTAVIKMTTNYLKLNDKFEKIIVLNNIDGKWRIHDYVLMPVKVK